MVAVTGLESPLIEMTTVTNVDSISSKSLKSATTTSSLSLFETVVFWIERMSLVKRMFILTGLVLLIFLSSAGLLINALFKISLDSVIQDKLQLYTYQLISVGDNVDGAMQLPRQLAEPRFNKSQGSLIGLVTELTPDGKQLEVWRSLSAMEKQFSFPAPQTGKWFFSHAQGANDVQYYVSSYNTTWSNQNGTKTQYVFTTIEELSYYRKISTKYQLGIVAALLGFGLVFLLLQTIILRLGLRPVTRVTSDVEALNRGEINSLTGNYPEELKSLTANLNLLINNERSQRERYRNRMADLSHSLKTPLSVLRGIETDIDSQGLPISRKNVIDTLSKHVKRMTEIVDHQLQRTVTSGAPTTFTAINVAVQANDIMQALNKVYAEKIINCVLNIEQGLAFIGDKNDLFEIIGNLLDNAYKHAEKTVFLSAIKDNYIPSSPKFIFTFEDDGAGIPLEKRSSILERGVRLDTNSDGQGFGLSIVAEIVNNYEGVIAIEDSDLGGAKFVITMPTH